MRRSLKNSRHEAEPRASRVVASLSWQTWGGTPGRIDTRPESHISWVFRTFAIAPVVRRNCKAYMLQGTHTQHHHHASLHLPKQRRSRSPQNQRHPYRRLGLRLKRLLAIFLRMDVPADGKTRYSLSKQPARLGLSFL